MNIPYNFSVNKVWLPIGMLTLIPSNPNLSPNPPATKTKQVSLINSKPIYSKASISLKLLKSTYYPFGIYGSYLY